MNVVIATTGTGGDLFPGIAVAEFLRKSGQDRLLFAVSGLGPEEEALQRYQFAFQRMPTGRLKGEGLGARFKTIVGIPALLGRARSLLKNFKAEVVLGTGGHSSGPVVMASRLLGVPCAIMEKNSIPGLTNRLLAPMVGRVYTSFPQTQRFFSRRKTLWVGTPVRESFSQVTPKPGGIFTLLVFGGSQGAASLNRALVEAAPILQQSGQEIRILHQTGRADFENVKKRYEALGLLKAGTIRVVPFIEQMAAAYQEADLVLSRAGASSLAELIAVRRPAILVPYPYAANDHQRFNALWMVEEGAAEMILDRDLSGASLAKRILHHQKDRSGLQKMAAALEKLPGRDAASKVAQDLKELSRCV